MDAPSLGWAYTYSPAGGVNSTVIDMAKWLRLHLSQGMYRGHTADQRGQHAGGALAEDRD